MKNIKEFIIESQNTYFTEEEKGKIMNDMWDKDGLFYKFMKDKVDGITNATLDDYLYSQCLDDDRCCAEFASYISEVIGRDNFNLDQVKYFIQHEDLKG